jgi:hypothetical protein
MSVAGFPLKIRAGRVNSFSRAVEFNGRQSGDWGSFVFAYITFREKPDSAGLFFGKDLIRTVTCTKNLHRAENWRHRFGRHKISCENGGQKNGSHYK